MHPLSLAVLTAGMVLGGTGGSLAERVRERIRAVPGARVAVAYTHLARADSLFVDAEDPFHAASTMKVPVMIELLRQVDEGRLSLNGKMPVVNRFASIVDGSPYTLDPADDEDRELYARVGRRAPFRELMERMITRSSNLATNLLIAQVGPARVTETARRLGATRTQVLRGVEDGKAYERGLNNTTTARDLAVLMTALQRDQAASPRSCALMREVLLKQELNEEIPAGLPPGTRVAHKTGQITATLHDAAIVYPAEGGSYVLVVLTAGIPDEKLARALIVDVSRMVYEHATREGAGRSGADGQGGAAPRP